MYILFSIFLLNWIFLVFTETTLSFLFRFTIGIKLLIYLLNLTNNITCYFYIMFNSEWFIVSKFNHFVFDNLFFPFLKNFILKKSTLCNCL